MGTLDDDTLRGLGLVARGGYAFRHGVQGLSPAEWVQAERVFQTCADKGMWGVPGSSPYFGEPGMLRRILASSYPRVAWLFAMTDAAAVHPGLQQGLAAWVGLEQHAPAEGADAAPLLALVAIDQVLPVHVRRGLGVVLLGEIARGELERGVATGGCWMAYDQRGGVEIMVAAGADVDESWNGTGWFVRCPWTRVLEAVTEWEAQAIR